jgi:hypothetical protein
MSVWIELRCDKAHEECAKPTGWGEERRECYTLSNSSPTSFASATQKSVIASFNDVKAAARRGGWSIMDSEFVCPHCTKTLRDEASSGSKRKKGA